MEWWVADNGKVIVDSRYWRRRYLQLCVEKMKAVVVVVDEVLEPRMRDGMTARVMRGKGIVIKGRWPTRILLDICLTEINLTTNQDH